MSASGSVFSDDQLQPIVEAESDAQVLLLPMGESWRVTHTNEAGRALTKGGDLLPELRAVGISCRSAWVDGRPVTLTNVLMPGDHRWYDVRVRRLYDHVSVIFADVTKRHDAQDALIDSQCRYRLVAENAGDLVFQVRGKRLEWVSTSLHDLLGWDQSDVIGHRVVDLVHPHDWQRVLEACEVQSHPTQFEARFKHRNGDWVPVSVFMRPAEDLGGGTARIGSCRAMVEPR